MTSFSSWDAAAGAAVLRIIEKFANSRRALDMQEIRDYFESILDDFFNFGTITYVDFEYLGYLAICGGQTSFPENPAEIAVHLTETLIRKQRDYGPENIARFGTQGILVRAHDKLARLENLISRGLSPENESVADNYLDLAGYAIVGSLWERHEFLLPLTVVESK